MTENRQVEARHPGQRIRDERERRGLSREGLAFKAGVSLRTIDRIEDGTTVPHRVTLRAILAALDLDVEQFGFMNGEAA